MNLTTMITNLILGASPKMWVPLFLTPSPYTCPKAIQMRTEQQIFVWKKKANLFVVVVHLLWALHTVAPVLLPDWQLCCLVDSL